MGKQGETLYDGDLERGPILFFIFVHAWIMLQQAAIIKTEREIPKFPLRNSTYVM